MEPILRADNFIIKTDTITGIRFAKRAMFYPTIHLDTEGGQEYRIEIPDSSPKSMDDIIDEILEVIGWKGKDEPMKNCDLRNKPTTP